MPEAGHNTPLLLAKPPFSGNLLQLFADFIIPQRKAKNKTDYTKF